MITESLFVSSKLLNYFCWNLPMSFFTRIFRSSLLKTHPHLIFLGVLVFQTLVNLGLLIFLGFASIRANITIANHVYWFFNQVALTLASLAFAYFSLFKNNIYDLYMFLGISLGASVVTTHTIFQCQIDTDSRCHFSVLSGFFLVMPVVIPEFIYIILFSFVQTKLEYDASKEMRTNINNQEKRKCHFHSLHDLPFSLFYSKIRNLQLALAWTGNSQREHDSIHDPVPRRDHLLRGFF